MNELANLGQDEAFFYLVNSKGKKEKVLFHDYSKIFKTPGLYEQIFYDRLRCNSPEIVTEILHKAVINSKENFTQLRVLDFGAGNGLMGEALKKYGVSRMVGADISKEAARATDRDRPGIYDEYYVEDFSNLKGSVKEELTDWSFDCLTTVAALGFGDIPVSAFFQAMNLVKKDGWAAFNIKESFLKPSDNSGFSTFIKQLILSDYLDVHFIERYQHRLSIEGEPLYYFAIVARKRDHVPTDLANL
jgi:predicted TPR repeat methyltransferase